MRPILSVVVSVVGLLTVSAFAQNLPATTPVRVAGTIEKLDGDNLTVKTKEGQAVTVMLNADAVIFGVEKRSVADIKPGIFSPPAGSRAATARSTRSKFGFFRRPCAASAKASVRGTPSPTE
jgi:hypothetical protein